jgi:aerotaxis receptor
MNTVSPSNEEYELGESVVISQTDAQGVITYVNRAFCKASGYNADELIGKKHSIVRHPDMPVHVFAKLWSAITGGRAWNGLIKNLRKDGLYYWVDIEILPIKDNNEQITGYIAASKEPSRKDIQENEELYKKMLEAQN